MEVDGHDIDSLRAVFHLAKAEKEKPVVILARTIKGMGFAFAENVVSFHNGMMTQEQYDEAMKA